MANWPAPSAPVYVSADALDWALKHVESFGDTIYLPRAFEYEASQEMRTRIGGSVIAAARKPSTGNYERMCLLSLFTHGEEFDNQERFEGLYRTFPDAETQRELILALGRAHKHHRFQARKRNIGDLGHWLRRAFIAGASCLPADVRRPFYRSLREGADILEGAVIKWAAAHPF